MTYGLTDTLDKQAQIYALINSVSIASMVFNCQFSQEKRNHDPQIVTKNNRVYLNSRLRNQISQRGIDTLGLLPPYEM